MTDLTRWTIIVGLNVLVFITTMLVGCAIIVEIMEAQHAKPFQTKI